MNKYEVAVDVYVTGTVTVTANTAEQAVEAAQELEAKLEDKLLPTKNTVLDFVSDARVTGMLSLDADRVESGARSYRTAGGVKTKVRAAEKQATTGVKVRSRRLREQRRG